jgi:ABC-type multidrug transport system fused ATPase/permease subunit
MTLATGLRFFFQVLGGVIVLFYLSWKLTLVMLLPMPVLGLAAAAYSRAVRGLGAGLQSSLALCTEVAEETISGVRHIRAFGKEEPEKARYNERVEGAFVLGKKMALLFGVFQGGAELSAYISIVLVVVYGTLLTLSDELSKGDLTAYLLYQIVVAHALGMCVEWKGTEDRAKYGLSCNSVYINRSLFAVWCDV